MGWPNDTFIPTPSERQKSPPGEKTFWPIDGPGYTRFLETEWVHLKQVPDSRVANSASLK